MLGREVTLAVAAFLDSPQARGLAAPAKEEVRRLVGAFVDCCYADLGKKPRLLDREEVESALSHGIPSRLRPRDPLAEHAPAVLTAFYDHLEETEVVPQAYEIRRGLDGGFESLRMAVEAGELAGRGGSASAPFVHGASKLGRNDPCSCGSGKKYKKCHGKGR